MDEKLYAKSLMTFDHTYEPQIEMYDKFPYARDIEVCDWKSPRMISGNVVKFFQYELGKKQIIQNDFEVEPEEELSELFELSDSFDNEEAEAEDVAEAEAEDVVEDVVEDEAEDVVEDVEIMT